MLKGKKRINKWDGYGLTDLKKLYYKSDLGCKK